MSPMQGGGRFRAGLSVPAVVALLASIALCGTILIVVVTDRDRTDRLSMEQEILEKTAKLTEILHRLVYKTEALAALVIQNNGEVQNFERVASTLLDEPSMANVLLAPGGVVTHVYPLQGNEAVLGLDFFKEGAGNTEAQLARETGQLVFGGPFPLVQGGQALVGRLPVYLAAENGEKKFWGLVSVTLKYPLVLDGLTLPLLEKQGYAFEIWRISPDTGERQVIAASDYVYRQNTRFIEKDVHILNAEWHFRLSPVKMWYRYTEIWVLIVLSLFASCLVAFVVQNNHELKGMQSRLEEMARSDSLTGIANRRHFMDTAPAQLQYASRNSQSSFIILFDVDHFKEINDTHGHAAGDAVLTILTDRVRKTVRPYDLFARYGGEEFILLVVGVDDAAAEALASRIRLAICGAPFRIDGGELAVTASFGVSRVFQDSDLDAAIKQADEALYLAKQAGRNATRVYGKTKEQ